MEEHCRIFLNRCARADLLCLIALMAYATLPMAASSAQPVHSAGTSAGDDILSPGVILARLSPPGSTGLFSSRPATPQPSEFIGISPASGGLVALPLSRCGNGGENPLNGLTRHAKLIASFSALVRAGFASATAIAVPELREICH